MMNKTCDRLHYECRHPCGGARGEENCPPCLHEDCVKKDEQKTLGCTNDSNCVICYTDNLGQAPSVYLKCKHIFHLDCLIRLVNNKWNGPRISFGFLDCPACG